MMQAAYFTKLQKALAAAGLAEPVLLLDKQKLDKNIRQLRRMLPKGMAYRIVAKSLPSAQLLAHIAERAKTDRLMSFNREMTEQLLRAMPKADQLLGKPLPVAAVAGMFDTLSAAKGKAAARQVQWLVDTPARLTQYEALAKKLRLKLRINLEIDVGLHRGGMMPSRASGEGLDAALAILAASQDLQLAGYLGYEPHLTKIPNLGGWRARAKKVPRPPMPKRWRRAARISATLPSPPWCAIWRVVRLSGFIRTPSWPMSWRPARRWSSPAISICRY